MSEEQMMQYKSFEEYIDAFSFRDSAEVYSNGIMLVPVFRVKQAMEYERRKKEMQQDATNDSV